MLRLRSQPGADDNPGVEPTDTRPIPPTREATYLGKSIEHWLILGAALVGIAALVVLGVWLDPDPRGFGTHEKLGLPPCTPMHLWNVPCPGCGVTTAVSLAAHGHLWPAFTTQPFGLLIAIGIPLFVLWCVVHTLRGRDLNHEVGRMRVGLLWIGVAAVMVASWGYKLAVVRHWFA